MQELIIEYIEDSLRIRTSDGMPILNQPFAPDGNQIPWSDESQAREWWDSVKDSEDMIKFIEGIISRNTPSGNI